MTKQNHLLKLLEHKDIRLIHKKGCQKSKSSTQHTKGISIYKMNNTTHK